MLLIFCMMIVFLSSVFGKIKFESGIQPSQLTLQDVKSLSYVLVQAEFELKASEKFEKVNLVIRSINKHKKQAYLDLMKKYHRVVRTLIKLKTIPNRKAMIHSIIHWNYLRKSKKWEFLRYFYIYALKSDISQIMQNLEKFHPETVKTAPIVNYLDEKFMSIAAFIEAKVQLQNVLKQRLNGKYKILLTKDVEIVTQKVLNQQIIENDIETEFNREKLKQEISEDSSKLMKQSKVVKGYYAENEKKKNFSIHKLEIKVLFQIVEKSADIEDILQEINEEVDEEDSSISDFEEEFLKQEEEGNSISEQQKDEEKEEEDEELDQQYQEL